MKANTIDSLKVYIQNKDTAAVINAISDNPALLGETDENGSSGLLIIAYSGFDAAFTKAKELKRSFTFHEAIVCGRINDVRDYLSDDHALVNTYSPDGFTPLSLAAFFDQTEIARLLLQQGADPDLHATNPSRVAALHSAVAKQNYELCRLLLEHGADVNSMQMQNVTALHSAAHRGNLQLVKLLVENGANITAKMDNGDTAIDIAGRDGHGEVHTYLENKVKNSLSRDR